MKRAVGRARGDDGLALVMFVLLMVGLLVMVAIVIDIGAARHERQRAQNATDAASLAAAWALLEGGADPAAAAVAEGRRYATTNLRVPRAGPPAAAVDVGRGARAAHAAVDSSRPR